MSAWTIEQGDDGRCDVRDAEGYLLAVNLSPADARRIVEAWETVRPYYVARQISAACDSAVSSAALLKSRFGS